MSDFKLLPHQVEAVEKISNGKLVKGGVGTGKTYTALAYYMKAEAPKDIYVITTARKRDSLDWVKEAAAFAIHSERSSFAGKLTVDSWQNVENYLDVKDAFFIFDEQRLVGSGAWVKAFYKIAKANNWIMLTATPGDTWMDYIPVFVANGYYKNRTEFIRTHVVWKNFTKFPKVDHYVETGRLNKYRRELVVDMHYERHTKRHLKTVYTMFDIELYEQITKKRWHIYEDRPLKDVGELFRVARKLCNSDVSRIRMLMQVLEKHPRLIVFYSFDYELEILRGIARALDYPVAEWNGHKHQEIPETSKWLYFVQYTAGAEAWNCITTDAIAFWSLQYSYKIFEQAMGRIDRLNTQYENLYYYILRSAAPIDVAIWRSLKGKESFSEKKHGGNLQLPNAERVKFGVNPASEGKTEAA